MIFLITFAPIFPSMAAKFKNGTGNMIDGDQYVTFICKVKDFIELLARTLQTV